MAEGERNRHFLIEEMIRLYLERGWTDNQLAEKLGTDRTNVYKIRTKEIEQKMGIPVLPVPDRRGYYFVSKEFYVQNIPFRPAEMLVLYLAGRRMQQQTKTAQRDVAEALKKLTNALNKPLAENLVKAAEQILAQEQDHQQEENLQKLMEAWLNGRKVAIKHRKPHGKLRSYTVSPYQLEPAVWGDGTYLIGYSDYHNGIASFKLSRIERVTITIAPAEEDETFDSHTLLQHAWGIWHADEEPELVRLRFNAFVTPRVKETIWHPSQTIKDLENGGCEWAAEVAEPREMLAWIRGWGSDVEVLEPEWLRLDLTKTVERLGEKYQLQPPIQRQPYQWLYAKTDRHDPENIHLLLYHLIDVGHVALELWNTVLSYSFKVQVAQQLSLEVEQAGRFVAFIASLHDLGKASPAYQKKYSPPWLKTKLVEAGFILDDPVKYSEETNSKKSSHAHITTWALPPLLVKYCGLDASFANKIGHALGGHHGLWPPNSAGLNFNDSACPAWNIARRELVWELRNVFQPPSISQPPVGEKLNIFLTLFSGLTSVADWLGSRDDRYAFPLVKKVITTRAYAIDSRQQAKRVLKDLGWTGWQPTSQTLNFSAMFQYLDEERIVEPRPVQEQIISLTKDLSAPSLTIIEAPTGIGKTEIAFYIADHLLQTHLGRGLYIAMPTQATSNQMFDRTHQFLQQRYPNDLVDLHLAHGQAAFDERIEQIRLRRVGDDEENGRVVAMSWFDRYSKRTLLAPFGVGTVDQALMSILQTKHFFVRLLGLSHKVVIFDEVHAYDTYMSTLFERLLKWLRAMGTSVIMLSATLPSSTRERFIYAYTKQTTELENCYPAITIASDDEPAQIHQLELGNLQANPPISAPQASLQLEWLPAEQQVKQILQAADHSGCIAVICNTVKRAQAIFQGLLDVYESGQLKMKRENLILFHAAFPPIWRKEIEEKTKRLFGKPRKEKDIDAIIDDRPLDSPAIIVATQVIEQSLDLDFDVMFTDMAPIDLLLQRAGRLHRHEMRDSQRHGHQRRLTIIQPKLDEQGIPDFESSEYIYERYILLRTYRALQQMAQNNVLVLPQQMIALIEAVYLPIQTKPNDNNPQWQAALLAAYKKMRKERHDSRQKAKRQLVEEPHKETLLHSTNLGLEEDNPTIHQTFQAKTRDIGPTLSLICLQATDQTDVALLDPNDPNSAIDLTEEPDASLVKELLQRRINTQNWALLAHFLEQAAPTGWQKQATLRHMRVVEFVAGAYSFTVDEDAYQLSLDRELGLRVENLSKKEDAK